MNSCDTLDIINDFILDLHETIYGNHIDYSMILSNLESIRKAIPANNITIHNMLKRTTAKVIDCREISNCPPDFCLDMLRSILTAIEYTLLDDPCKTEKISLANDILTEKTNCLNYKSDDRHSCLPDNIKIICIENLVWMLNHTHADNLNDLEGFINKSLELLGAIHFSISIRNSIIKTAEHISEVYQGASLDPSKPITLLNQAIDIISSKEIGSN